MTNTASTSPEFRLRSSATGGRAAVRRVLFIQGVGVIGEGWRPQLDGLGDRYTTISFDNRGLGETALGSAPLTVEAMALDALAIMDAEKIEQFHVVGHSMGGLIAQEVALRAPGRVKSLALLCTFARGKQATRLTPAIVLIGLRTRLGTRAMRRNAFLELVMPPALLAEQRPRPAGREAARRCSAAIWPTSRRSSSSSWRRWRSTTPPRGSGSSRTFRRW